VGAETARVDSHQLSAVSVSLTRDYGLVQASATLALIDSQAGGSSAWRLQLPQRRWRYDAKGPDLAIPAN